MNNNQNPRVNPQRRQAPAYQPSPPPRRKRRKKKMSFLAVIALIVLFALIAVGVLFAGIYFTGVRYIKVQVTEDLYVKFLGQVDDDGNPYKGRIVYSDGISAEVNLDREEIS